MIPAVLVAADMAGTLLLTDRTDARVRATQQSGAVGVGTQQIAPSSEGLEWGFDLANRATADLDAKNRYWDLKLTYSPDFTLTDLEEGFDLQVLQMGSASAAWHDRRVRLTLSETGSYGQINSAYAFIPGVGSVAGTMGTAGQTTTVNPPVSPQAAPAPQTLTFVSTSTTLRSDIQADRKVSFYLSANYTVSGGINSILLPETYGPRFDAGLTYAFARRDQLVTNAYAQAAIISTEQCIAPDGVAIDEFCHPEAQVAQLTEGLRHAFDPLTSLTLDAGAAVSRTRQKDAQPFGFAVYPVGVATFQHAYRGRDNLTLRADAEYQPVIDARSGYTASRIQGDLSFSDTIARHMRLTVTASASQTIPPSAPLSLSLVRGEVDLDYQVSRLVDLTIGDSTGWQNQAPLGEFFSSYLFLAVTVAAPALRF